MPQRAQGRRAFCLGLLSYIGAGVTATVPVSALAAPPQAAVVDAASIYALAAPSVVVVEAQTTGGRSQGSGVVVAPGLIVTNRHVVDGAIGHILIRQGKGTWRSEIEITDEVNDLALLGILLGRTERFDLKVAKKAGRARLRVGEKVFAIGAPRGLEHTLSDGLISGLPEGVPVVQTTAPISPGSSGGGLFNLRGEVVGITTLYLKDSQNINFALSIDAVEALQKQGASQPRRPFDAGGGLATPTSSLRPTLLPLGLGSLEAVVVEPHADGPIAAEGGINEAWIARQVRTRLQNVGIAVYDSVTEANAAGIFAPPFVVTLRSLHIQNTVFYPWMLDLSLIEYVDFADGSNNFVTTWSDGRNGYGGSEVVVEQVGGALDALIRGFAATIIKAKNPVIAPRPSRIQRGEPD